MKMAQSSLLAAPDGIWSHAVAQSVPASDRGPNGDSGQPSAASNSWGRSPRVPAIASMNLRLVRNHSEPAALPWGLPMVRGPQELMDLPLDDGTGIEIADVDEQELMRLRQFDRTLLPPESSIVSRSDTPTLKRALSASTSSPEGETGCSRW